MTMGFSGVNTQNPTINCDGPDGCTPNLVLERVEIGEIKYPRELIERIGQ